MIGNEKLSSRTFGRCRRFPARRASKSLLWSSFCRPRPRPNARDPWFAVAM